MKNVTMNGPMNALRISLSNFFIMPAVAVLNANCSNLMLRMKQQPKLTLSDEELQLVNNAGWILTKHTITGKVYELFGHLAEEYKTVVEKENLPLAVVQSSPKISKGENYLLLPYVMLDYPRCFGGENIFAVRTMFWWGNFFSITLQLSGGYKKMFEENLVTGYDQLKQHGFYVCNNEDAWQHHFEKENYISLDQLTKEELQQVVLQKEFIKLAVKFPLNYWSKIAEMFPEKFSLLMQLLKT